MKGAFVISANADLYVDVRAALVRAGATAAGGDVVQLRDEVGTSSRSMATLRQRHTRSGEQGRSRFAAR
jgi:hypothetical protein